MFKKVKRLEWSDHFALVSLLKRAMWSNCSHRSLSKEQQERFAHVALFKRAPRAKSDKSNSLPSRQEWKNERANSNLGGRPPSNLVERSGKVPKKVLNKQQLSSAVIKLVLQKCTRCSWPSFQPLITVGSGNCSWRVETNLRYITAETWQYCLVEIVFFS